MQYLSGPFLNPMPAPGYNTCRRGGPILDTKSVKKSRHLSIYFTCQAYLGV